MHINLDESGGQGSHYYKMRTPKQQDQCRVLQEMERERERVVESSELQHLEGKLSGQVTANEDSRDRKRGGWKTFPFIIGNVLGVSLAAGGFMSNIIVFLISEFNVKSIKATQINNIIQGCINLFPVAGAILADSYLGAFAILTICPLISLVGMIMLTLTATINSLRPPPCVNGSFLCEAPSKIQYAVLYAGLALSSIGVGVSGFTAAPWGADQFEKISDQEVFFNWYFLTVYVSNVISFTAIIYIQDNVSWGLGFGICVAANTIGLAIFLLGKRFYRLVKPMGSPFSNIARVMVAAVRKRKMSGNLESQADYYYGDIGMSNMPYTAPTKSFRFLNGAALKSEGDIAPDGSSNARPWRLCSVQEVEDLKTLIKILPLWSSGIFISIPIGLLNSLTVLQALTMDRHLGPHFKIPPASFLMFHLLATAMVLSIIDRVLIPAWQKMIGRVLTPLQRIGLGHLLNILSMVAAASVEIQRLHVYRTHRDVMGQPGSTVPLSALWLVVPQAIVGIGEALHFPGQVAFYYQEFPSSLRTTSTAMIALVHGIGFYLSTVVIGLVHQTTGWLPDNINDGRLDNVYWMLAVIGAINFGYFLTCAMLFKYQNIEKSQDVAS